MIFIVHVKGQEKCTWSVDCRPVIFFDCIFEGETRGNHLDVVSFVDKLMDDAVLCDRATVDDRVV
jgi:hypothetical protein